jgi:RNA polymerase sigma-70 factor (ECF subfamily)
MLAEDARMTMPPQPSWYQGRDAIDVFLGLRPLAPDTHFRLTPIAASGQPALAAYIRHERTGAFEAESIVVLTLRDDRIEEITAFRNGELFPRFGLPDSIRRRK